MKTSFNNIIKQFVVGKRLLKQKYIDEKYWGATIIDVYSGSDKYDYDCYTIVTDGKDCNQFVIDPDYELEIE